MILKFNTDKNTCIVFLGKLSLSIVFQVSFENTSIPKVKVKDKSLLIPYFFLFGVKISQYVYFQSILLIEYNNNIWSSAAKIWKKNKTIIKEDKTKKQTGK